MTINLKSSTKSLKAYAYVVSPSDFCFLKNRSEALIKFERKGAEFFRVKKERKKESVILF